MFFHYRKDGETGRSRRWKESEGANWGVLNESTTAHEVDVLTSVGITEDARRDDVAKGAEQLFQLRLEQIIVMIIVMIKMTNQGRCSKANISMVRYTKCHNQARKKSPIVINTCGT